MAKKQKTKYAILGLLSWKPMSGYDINKMIEAALSHFWSESYGQLFPTLKKLVDEGLAQKKVAAKTGKRARHVYTITARGRRVFDAWLHEPADPPRMRNELQLKFFLTSRRSAKDSLKLLDEYKNQQEERLLDYKESEAILNQALRSDEPPEMVQELLGEESTNREPSNELLIFFLTLRHGILAIEARLKWVDESVKALKSDRVHRR